MGYDPKFLKSDNPTFIDKIPDEPTCAESFCNYPPLGCLPIYDVRWFPRVSPKKWTRRLLELAGHQVCSESSEG